MLYIAILCKELRWKEERSKKEDVTKKEERRKKEDVTKFHSSYELYRDMNLESGIWNGSFLGEIDRREGERICSRFCREKGRAHFTVKSLIF